MRFQGSPVDSPGRCVIKCIIGHRMPEKKPKNFKPLSDWPKGHKWHKSGRRRCQKWAYGPGRQCEKQALDNLDCCANHGGKSLKGAAAPNYKHGGFSRYATKPIADRINEWMQDPELLNLSEDVAIWNYRIELLIQELSGAGGIESWDKLAELYAALAKAIRESDLKAIAENLNAIGELIQAAQSEYMLWHRIENAQEHKIKIVAAEHKRRVDMQMLLDRTELVLIIDNIYNLFMYILEQNLKDDRILRVIKSETSNGLRGLVSGNISG